MTAPYVDPWDETDHVITPGGRRPIAVDVARVLAKLQHLADRLEDAATALRDAEGAATDAKIDYELGYARAVLAAKGTNQKAREAEALVAVHDKYRAWMNADRVVRTSRDLTYAIREQIRAYQSISVIIREATAAPMR
jgi:hypothetical protein